MLGSAERGLESADAQESHAAMQTGIQANILYAGCTVAKSVMFFAHVKWGTHSCVEYMGCLQLLMVLVHSIWCTTDQRYEQDHVVDYTEDYIGLH